MVDTRRRVKLYVLNDERQWDDRGTGHVSSAYVERLKGMSLLVRAESDGSLLLESKIQPDTAYQKQQETLIVWSEADNYDLALSFQEKAGCDEIWEKICQVQGKDPSVDITQDIIEESEEERFEEIPDAAPPIELPPCELSKLEEISELFSSVLLSPVRREKLAIAIENDNYIKNLLELFHMCEDLENLEGLRHIYEIFKSIFLLNKNALLELMFSDDIIMDVIGCLEYDPNQPQPIRHREYLNTKANFKEVIPITNIELLHKIHQTYRVQYIQDVVLPTPSVFEENMLSTLSSFIFFNKVEIVSMIQDDDKFLPELFALLTDEATDDGKRKELVFFLKEYCTFAQTFQNRDGFFKMLSNLGILPALEVILAMDDADVRQAAIDIFAHIVEYSPSMVREFILQEANTQDDEVILMNLVIEQMICDPDTELGGAVQLMGLIRILIDPENMLATVNQKTEKTEFLSFFYKHCMHVLTAPLLANTTDDVPCKDDYQTSQLLSLILELLSFCVEHHTYHIKNYIINKDFLRRVLILMKSRHTFLVLSVVRFVRRIIGMKDEFYNRYIIKGQLFLPVVNAFQANGDRYNLLNSAILEMFEFIRMEDVKSLITHLIETHYGVFEKVDYVQTFKVLKLKYEQQQDRLNDKPILDNIHQAAILHNSRFRRDPRSLEEEEEIWFEQEDEPEDGEAIVPVADMLKNKMEADLDHISKIIDGKKGHNDLDNKDVYSNTTSSTRPSNPLVNSNRTSSPPATPIPTKVASPPSPGLTPNSITRKTGIVGLVDYPDEDSDEDENDDDNSPPSKRVRLTP
uniref:Serine/threonine-protein phosphatase 4 regulatory subunit 3A isoform X4 n=1 Tax=Saccoglossus kowalevskii TaxID=10224 RepID=A0ABM0LWQ6_SACKO|nr:PREDICTED: serine/threonine-protein phosphatase 4 regulatory subunit 3A isoform X4 [Saccoglossus kowalevskii]